MVRIYLNTVVLAATVTILISFILDTLQINNPKVIVSYTYTHPQSSSVVEKNDTMIDLDKSSAESASADRFSIEGNHSNSSEKGHIYFIVTTEYSLTQPAKLTKIAQALFPVREFVTLVLVKTYTLQDGIQHLASLDKLLKRFGIPYVILSNRQFENKCKDTFTGSSLPDTSQTDPITRHWVGRVVGLVWVLQTSKSGVIMMANEDYTYYHRIFNEIRHTKKISTWPLAFDKSNQEGFSAPIVNNHTVRGYFNYHFARFGIVRLQIGGFGINIKYLKKKAKKNVKFLSNLASDSDISNNELEIPIEDVSVLSKLGTEISVWRTVFDHYHWPKQIGLRVGYKGTNMPALMKNFFGESMYYKYYLKFRRTLYN